MSKRKNAEPDKKSKKAKKDDSPEPKIWDLGKSRKVSLSQFKGSTYVDIREYYMADGEEKPGKKGISLSIEQWGKLLNFADEVNKELKAKGFTITLETEKSEQKEKKEKEEKKAESSDEESETVI